MDEGQENIKIAYTPGLIKRQREMLGLDKPSRSISLSGPAPTPKAPAAPSQKPNNSGNLATPVSQPSMFGFIGPKGEFYHVPDFYGHNDVREAIRNQTKVPMSNSKFDKNFMHISPHGSSIPDNANENHFGTFSNWVDKMHAGDFDNAGGPNWVQQHGQAGPHDWQKDEAKDTLNEMREQLDSGMSLTASEHRFTDKQHRQHDHIVESEKERGVSPEKADEIGWATVNKQAAFLVHAALVNEMQRRAEKDPCWKGYEMAGTKKKNGKTVPNCIPKSKQADAFMRFLSKYADTQPSPPVKKTHQYNWDQYNTEVTNPEKPIHQQELLHTNWEDGQKSMYDEPRVTDFKVNPKLISRNNLKNYAAAPAADNLKYKIDEGKKSKDYVGWSPEKRAKQPPDKGNAVQKGKNLAKTKPSFKSASVTEQLFNIYQEAYVLPRSKASTSLTDKILGIYQEAYGVSGPSSSGGSYGMGQGIDMSSKQTINNPMNRRRTEEDSASPLGDIPTYPMKDTKKGPMDPFKLPGGPATKGMTVNDRKQQALQPINDARKTQRDKDMAMWMQQFETPEKGPSKMRQFVDWLKGVHQKTFGSGKMSPDELALQRQQESNNWGKGFETQAAEIRGFIKTAVLDNNEFRTILAAMNEMGYSSSDILKAFNS